MMNRFERHPLLARYRAVVDQHGSRPAVVWRGETLLTHAQLWAAAEGFAELLRKQNNSTTDMPVVALRVTHSPAWPVAVLGCWLAGFAFAPIDNQTPAAREAQLCEELQPFACFTLTEFAPYLQQKTASKTRDIPLLELPEPEQAAVSVSAKGVAYVVYTSGSSGRPKGVLVGFDGLLPMLEQQIADFALTETSRNLAYLSLCFDAALSDLGTTLLAGAALILEPRHTLPFDSTLLDLLASRQVTHADLPPALLPFLDPKLAPPCLQTVIYGGAECAPAVVRAWAQTLRLVCVYGPTEATICTSSEVINPKNIAAGSIGKPFAHLNYRLCNKNDASPSKPGESKQGELLISGNQLALGYLNQPEQTTQQFCCINKQRWYRTGDLVQRHPDGRYVFLGRIDRMLKLAGKRLAPEEVERILSTLPGVAQAVVLADADQCLTAVIQPNGRPSPDKLKVGLARFLPDWMIPSRFVFCEHWPTTATGKTDMSAVRALVSSANPPTELSDMDATNLLELLETLWRGLFSGHKEGNFFELGGTSMTALRLQSEAARHQVHIPLRLLYNAPTPAKLATALAQQNHQTEGYQVSALRQRIDREYRPPQGRAICPRMSVYQPWLITGARGRFGQVLVEHLIRKDTRELWLLQRAPSAAEATAWWADWAAHRGLSAPFARRVRVFHGDYTQPDFGMARADFAAFEQNCSGIVHLGALPGDGYTFEQQWHNHVNGTRQAANWCRSRGACLFYVSSLALFPAQPGCVGRVSAETAVNEDTVFTNAYAATKWAGEAVVRESGTRGAILRLGLLDCDPTNHLVTQLCDGLQRLGVVPVDPPEITFDLTPSIGAAALVRTLMKRDHRGQGLATIHLANPNAVSAATLCRRLIESGAVHTAVDAHTFAEQLAQTRTLHPLQRALIEEMTTAPSNHRARLFCSTGLDYGVDATFAAHPGLHHNAWDAATLLKPLLGAHAGAQTL